MSHPGAECQNIFYFHTPNTLNLTPVFGRNRAPTRQSWLRVGHLKEWQLVGLGATACRTSTPLNGGEEAHAMARLMALPWLGQASFDAHP